MNSQINVFLEVKTNYNWEAVEISTEQNILVKSIIERYLLFADWIASNFNNIWYWDPVDGAVAQKLQ